MFAVKALWVSRLAAVMLSQVAVELRIDKHPKTSHEAKLGYDEAPCAFRRIGLSMNEAEYSSSKCTWTSGARFQPLQ